MIFLKTSKFVMAYIRLTYFDNDVISNIWTALVRREGEQVVVGVVADSWTWPPVHSKSPIRRRRRCNAPECGRSSPSRKCSAPERRHCANGGARAPTCPPPAISLPVSRRACACRPPPPPSPPLLPSSSCGHAVRLDNSVREGIPTHAATPTPTPRSPLPHMRLQRNSATATTQQRG